MAHFKFSTDEPAESLAKLATRRARELGFMVEQTRDLAFRAKMGHMLASILLGAIMAYCDFLVTVEEFDDGTDLVIDWSPPWWTGLIGTKRTRSWAKELADKLKDELEDRGRKVWGEEEK